MIKLGDKVKDKVSGLIGIAIVRCVYLNGCDRIGIQVPTDKDGKVPDPYYVDEMQCERVDSGEYYGEETKPSIEKTGGPSGYKI